MKITIDVDLTPSELREVMALPDVKSIQDRWLSKLEEAMAGEIEKLSPETIAQQWAGALIPNTDLLASMMKMMPGLADKK